MRFGSFCAWTMLCLGVGAGAQEAFPLQVLPAEHRQVADPATGAQLTFLTTDPAHDQSLYYEQRSWLADSSLIIFNSQRDGGGLMGYLVQTGELVRLATPKGGLGGPTAAVARNSVYAMRGADVLELSLNIEPSADPAAAPSKVTATERLICTLGPENLPPNTALTENADGTKLALGVGGRLTAGGPDGKVIANDVADGTVDEVYRVPGEERCV